MTSRRPVTGNPIERRCLTTTHNRLVVSTASSRTPKMVLPEDEWEKDCDSDIQSPRVSRLDCAPPIMHATTKSSEAPSRCTALPDVQAL